MPPRRLARHPGPFSSGRKPLFFWLLRQFFRSASLCAMLTSPHRMKSRSAFQTHQVRVDQVRKRNLLALLALLARGAAGGNTARMMECAPRLGCVKRSST